MDLSLLSQLRAGDRGRLICDLYVAHLIGGNITI